jgi:osmoprotectant transport system ATP-binding protein
VSFTDVGKRFGEHWALRHVNLDVPRGACTAVVGESGSGKSTLLQLINVVHRPEEGALTVFDERLPEDLPRFRRRIGYAVQGAGLFPHLTVEDNVTLVAKLEGWSRDDRVERCVALMTLLGLEPVLMSRHPGSLSGGQQQRVGLCRALMLKPELLLLDEPFSAVDPITRIGLHDEFVELSEVEKVTTILVTHDMREAAKLADHLVIVRSGSILQAGPLQAVLDAPADDYVARLFKAQLS